jgi:ribonuclease HI
LAGAGRVILDSRANQEVIYAWGIGIATNNEAEALALFKGILLLKAQRGKGSICVGKHAMRLAKFKPVFDKKKNVSRG